MIWVKGKNNKNHTSWQKKNSIQKKKGEREDKIKNIGKSWSSTTKEKITKTHLEWFVM